MSIMARATRDVMSVQATALRVASGEATCRRSSACVKTAGRSRRHMAARASAEKRPALQREVEQSGHSSRPAASCPRRARGRAHVPVVLTQRAWMHALLQMSTPEPFHREQAARLAVAPQHMHRRALWSCSCAASAAERPPSRRLCSTGPRRPVTLLAGTPKARAASAAPGPRRPPWPRGQWQEGRTPTRARGARAACPRAGGARRTWQTTP
mmetsp:Transcript_26738/g.89514  ORF Transcript_26738/g.89514 Transcript_26738/m.89514 type:complete len:212 (+) Transcript_26738:1781-2416(+)